MHILYLICSQLRYKIRQIQDNKSCMSRQESMHVCLLTPTHQHQALYSNELVGYMLLIILRNYATPRRLITHTYPVGNETSTTKR